jgi:acetylornithine deacetylase/succinyl-diaminopimelate desuccinylase-like protein
MKGQVAAGAVAVASLAREGFRPNGDLILVASADEEVGADIGVQWLVREHPEAVRAEYALNEGGGERLVLGGRTLYLCGTAEKTSAPFRVRVHGRSGHASTPAIADNALVKAAALVRRLAAHEPERSHGPETEALAAAITGGPAPPVEDVLRVVGEVDPRARVLLEPLLATTFSPTMISASQTRNVVPAVCEVTVDCRLQPGTPPAGAELLVRELAGELGLEVDFELVEAHGGTRSPAGTPLWDAVASWLAGVEPGAALVPCCGAGFTDSHWLRQAFGTVAYGFFPLRTMDAELADLLVHSADERVHVDDLALGLDFLRHAARAVGAMQAA